MILSVAIHSCIFLELTEKLTVVNLKPEVVVVDLLQGMLKDDVILQLTRSVFKGVHVALGIQFLSIPPGLSIFRLDNPILLIGDFFLALGIPWATPMLRSNTLLGNAWLTGGILVWFAHVRNDSQKRKINLDFSEIKIFEHMQEEVHWNPRGIFDILFEKVEIKYY